MKALALVLAFVPVLPIPAQPVVSPEVHPDRSVTFRLAAPDARGVTLRCEGVAESALQKQPDGVWSFTTEPLAPDIYSYSFVVDGVRMPDPANPLLKYNLLDTTSQVHVPGPPSLPWEINEIPHGVIHRHFYQSAVIGLDRDFYVYTPPEYDPASARAYPVLYLLHGYSDAADAWTSVGCANVILDNLIARGQAKPMVVVMPLGYGNQEVLAGGWARVRTPETQAIRRDSDTKFRDALLNEIIPMVEHAYRVSSDRRDRAIAGLSMGGRQSLLIGLNAPDRFAWIGAFSSGGVNADFAATYPAVDASLSARLRLLWVSCGQQDGLLDVNQQLVEWLTAKGVTVSWLPVPGEHSFRVWRRNLAQFVPLLFQGKSRP